MKRPPWGLAIALCLLAVVLVGCVTGREGIAAGDRGHDSKGKCEWSYELEPGTTKVKQGKLELSEASKKNGCEVEVLGNGASMFIGGLEAQMLRVTSVRGRDIAFDLDGVRATSAVPRGWCYRCYPDGNGGWTCVRYPC